MLGLAKNKSSHISSINWKLLYTVKQTKYHSLTPQMKIQKFIQQLEFIFSQFEIKFEINTSCFSANLKI